MLPLYSFSQISQSNFEYKYFPNEFIHQTSQKNKDLDNSTKSLRYIYIYSTSGLLNDNKISKEEAKKRVQFLLNKELIMPSHPYDYGDKGILNSTKIDENQKNTFFSCCTNKIGTQIFSFEYVTISDKIIEDKKDFINKNIQLAGVLSEILIEGNLLPRFKLKFINGKYRILE